MIAYEILRENYCGKWKVSKRISLCHRLLLFSINLSTFVTVIEKKNKDLWLIYEIQAILYYTTTATTLF